VHERCTSGSAARRFGLPRVPQRARRPHLPRGPFA
jgi:hypothetical protein